MKCQGALVPFWARWTQLVGSVFFVYVFVVFVRCQISLFNKILQEITLKTQRVVEKYLMEESLHYWELIWYININIPLFTGVLYSEPSTVWPFEFYPRTLPCPCLILSPHGQAGMAVPWQQLQGKHLFGRVSVTSISKRPLRGKAYIDILQF